MKSISSLSEHKIMVSPKFFDFHFHVNLHNDPYGIEFWQLIEDGSYEPDTIDFLRRNMNEDASFFDIGAANGAMTLIAASLGATVHSYEPMMNIFQVLERNVQSNPNLMKKTSIYQAAISDYNGSLSLTRNNSNNVISEIVIENTDMKIQSAINVLSLRNILQDFSNLNIYMKIDIEGAEYALLNDLETLDQMSNSSVILLLALHPGFLRPYSSLPKIFGVIERGLWRARNMLDNFRLYNNVTKYANVFRSNEVKVTSAGKFTLLAASGVFEFIVKFGMER